MSQTIQARGSSPALAVARSHKMLELFLGRQATMLACIDDFKIWAITALCMVPLALP